MFLNNEKSSGKIGREILLYNDEKQSLLPDDDDDYEIGTYGGHPIVENGNCDNNRSSANDTTSSSSITRLSSPSNNSMNDELKPIINGNATNVELAPTISWTHHHSHNYKPIRASNGDINNHCHTYNPQHKLTSSEKAKNQLIIGMLLCLIFMIAEFLGGYFANSLAIMTEAAHLLTDLASFIMNLFAVWISTKRPTKRMSFGFSRAEVLGAVAGIFLIWIITGLLFYAAINRIRHQDYEIDTNIMLIISTCGVLMNITICKYQFTEHSTVID